MNTPTSIQPEPSTSPSSIAIRTSIASAQEVAKEGNVQPVTALPTPSEATSDNPQSAPVVSERSEDGHRNPQSDRLARLPKPTRDMLNLMLDDGLPYHVILDELGETAQGLTAASLAHWVKGSYQDYLKERQTIEDVKTESEFAADLLRELGNVDPSVIHQACLVTTSDGFLIRGGFQPLPTGARSIHISRQGNVSYRAADGRTHYHVQLARFDNPAGLEPIGLNLFRETVISGPAELGQPGERGFGELVQGFLELSNVHVAEELVDLIRVQRAYEAFTQATQAAEKMRSHLDDFNLLPVRKFVTGPVTDPNSQNH